MKDNYVFEDDRTWISNLHDHVYEGLWKNNSGRPFKWTLTLKDFRAFLLLASLGILMTFTQGRSWNIGRYIIYHCTKCGTRSDQRDLRRLSIISALGGTLKSLKMLLRKLRCKDSYGLQDALDHEAVSPWFGIFAVLNTGLFIMMGVWMPFILTDASMEAPVVVSRTTNKCLMAGDGDVEYGNSVVTWRNLPQAEAIMQQCLHRLNDSCDKQYYLQQPKIQKRRIKMCPFPAGICNDSIMPVELTHYNISAYDMWVNSQAKVTMNHRLTCAPIKLDPFYHFSAKNGTPLHAIITVQTGEEINRSIGVELRTLNGPNFASGENSGLSDRIGAFDLNILPNYIYGQDAMDSDHPALHRSDAMPFLVIYRGGSMYFHLPIDDPFFSAHNVLIDNKTIPGPQFFVADREATALGCAEQFQFCVAGSTDCTGWGRWQQGSALLCNLTKRLIIRKHEASLADIAILFRNLPHSLSVYRYLARRAHFGGPQLTHPPYGEENIEIHEELWVTQVETWFTKGFLDAILNVRRGIRFPLDYQSHRFDTQFKKKYSLCGRILLRDGNYTNLNWVGCLTLTILLVLICCTSYVVEMITLPAINLFDVVTSARENMASLWRRIVGPRRSFNVFNRSGTEMMSSTVAMEMHGMNAVSCHIHDADVTKKLRSPLDSQEKF